MPAAKRGRSRRQARASNGRGASKPDSLPDHSERTSASHTRRQLQAHVGEAHFFQGASHVNIGGGAMMNAIVNNIHLESSDPLGILDAHVAPNAILNAGGRADEVRCYPGTREEVISRAENWMKSGYKQDRRIFWLSGPAGAGKSAIMQTLAENCIKRKAPMANFFFFRADNSRNRATPVVATLARQLIQLYPRLKSAVSACISEDRLIFSAPLRDQFKKLIDNPMRSRRRGSRRELPIILLIDGLDECDSRPQLDTAAKSEQRSLLRMLHDIATSPGSQFLVLLASRVESHIEMGFNDIGYANASIYLNEYFNPDADIRNFVTGELSRIKRAHPLGRHLDPQWPPESIISTIVAKSSGQFIYAATMCRFIADCPQCPSFAMQTVMKIREPHKRSPFADIDALYTFILSRCEHWDHVRDILAVYGLQRRDQIPYPTHNVDPSAIGYSDLEVASIFADMTSIVEVAVGQDQLFRFYHASFLDFIYSAERAGQYYVDVVGFVNSVAPAVVLRLPGLYGAPFATAERILSTVTIFSESLSNSLKELASHKAQYSQLTGGADLAVLKRLCAGRDEDLYRQIEHAYLKHVQCTT